MFFSTELVTFLKLRIQFNQSDHSGFYKFTINEPGCFPVRSLLPDEGFKFTAVTLWDDECLVKALVQTPTSMLCAMGLRCK